MTQSIKHIPPTDFASLQQALRTQEEDIRQWWNLYFSYYKIDPQSLKKFRHLDRWGYDFTVDTMYDLFRTPEFWYLIPQSSGLPTGKQMIPLGNPREDITAVVCYKILRKAGYHHLEAALHMCGFIFIKDCIYPLSFYNQWRFISLLESTLLQSYPFMDFTWILLNYKVTKLGKL